MPAAGSIHWKPLRDPHYVLVSLQQGQGGTRQLFVQQAVLLRVQALSAAAATNAPLLGLLLGHRWDCPITGTRYLLIDSLAEGPAAALTEEAQTATLGGLLARRQRDNSLECIGWYSAKRGVGSHMTIMESAVHLALFRAPWQTALLVGDGGRAGGFFQRDVLESRWFQAPFYEVVESKVSGDATRPTCIDWPEYLTTDLVAPLIRPQPARRESPERRVAESPKARPAPPAVSKPAAVPLFPSSRPAVRPPAAGRVPPAPVPQRAPRALSPETMPGAKQMAARLQAATHRLASTSSVALGVARSGVRRGAAAMTAAYGRLVARVFSPVAAAARDSAEALRRSAERARVARAPVTQLAAAAPNASPPRPHVSVTPPAVAPRPVPPARIPPVPAARPAVAPFAERPLAHAVAEPRPAPVAPSEQIDREDTTVTDSPYRYLALARREGFQVGAKLERGTPERPETLWLLNELTSGFRLTLITTDDGVREATLHYNRRVEDDALLYATPLEHRDVESRTIYVREPCQVGLRARCRRLRATGMLEPEWKVAPSVQPQPVAPAGS